MHLHESSTTEILNRSYINASKYKHFLNIFFLNKHTASNSVPYAVFACLWLSRKKRHDSGFPLWGCHWCMHLRGTINRNSSFIKVICLLLFLKQSL